jgi:hypothetical protein
MEGRDGAEGEAAVDGALERGEWLVLERVSDRTLMHSEHGDVEVMVSLNVCDQDEIVWVW